MNGEGTVLVNGEGTVLVNGEGTIGKISNQGTNDPAEGSRFRTFRTISENPRFMLFHLGWWGWGGV